MFLRAVVLLLLTLFACVPQLSMSDWRGTEARRVQIAQEMVQSGDWLVPTIGGEPTWAKPPLHYWLLGAVSELCGDGRFWMRIPSVVGLFASALFAMVLLRRWYGDGAGWVGALGVLCAPLALFEWGTSEIDPLFASLTAMSLWALATGVARERGALVVLSGAIGGLALLQKGPPYFLFAAGAYLVWWRRRGLRFTLHHFAPLIAVPLCYFVPVWLFAVAPAEMLGVAGDESVGRLVGMSWRQLVDTPEYLARAIAVQLPLVAWCFWEWRGARNARMDAADLTLRMCSGGAVLAVLLLMFFPLRPTRYLMPNVPLFTFAVAPAVAHFARQERLLGAFSRRLLAVLGVAAALGLLAAPFVPNLGVAAAGFFLVVALWSRAVTTPRRLVAFALALPVVAAWTLGLAWSEAWATSSRGMAPTAAVLRTELDRLGARDLVTHGHVDGKLLLGAGLLPKGDETARSVPQAKWVLAEVPLSPRIPQQYRERLLVASGGVVFAVVEDPSR
ncbi:MAG: glycosyltransferase family 39 protein [Planctomycetota bacterium]